MENNLWEKISCKYILKKIFSCLKVTKALKIIKLSEKIKTRLDISLFHYQYYYFFVLFKKEKIEKIEDILESPNINIFPDKTKDDLVLKFIESKKLFHDEYLYLNIDDKNTISLFSKLNEKKTNKGINYIIGNIEEKNIDIDIEKNYHDSISKIIEMEKNNVDKILFDYNFLFDKSNKSIIDIYCLNVKNLFINITGNWIPIYNISLFQNLEYLSIKSSSKSQLEETIKIILSEIQFKKIKTLKIIEPGIYTKPIQNLIFENRNNAQNCFENLKELYINEKLINEIKLIPENLQKLNINYDLSDKIYTFNYLQNSINNIILKYSSLSNLNIFFNRLCCHYANGQFYVDITKFILDSVINIETFSLNFLDENYYESCLQVIIKKFKNQKSKFIIKKINNNVPFLIFETKFDKIEKFEVNSFLSHYNYNDKYALYIKKNDSISTLNLINLDEKNGFSELPSNSFSSLRLLHILNIKLTQGFPLFSYDSSVKFLNLEYLRIHSSEISIINAVINNFINMPNLRVLTINNGYFYDSGFNYHKVIISKCELLKKLDILIIGGLEYSVLKRAYQYYSLYPELKNTNIRFCFLSEIFKH